MTIQIKLSSFRFKIILTLILVVAIASFASLYFYNHTLSKKIYRNTEQDINTFLYFFKDQIISIHDGRVIKPSLQELTRSQTVTNSFLIDSKGKVVYPPNPVITQRDSVDLASMNESKQDVWLKTYDGMDAHFSRAFIRFNNSQTCHECHSPDIKTLGYVVLDFPLHSTENTFTYTRNFSLFFTILMIVVIVAFVMVMHYKFIKKSLADFKNTIQIINGGNLSGRVKIPESKELGELGKNFNMMLENFQQTQDELNRYHAKEIRDKQKLASIGEMSARLAHEIRNPITGIANAVEIIIDESKDESNKPILEEIQRQANRVNKAISNLLNYSRSKELHLQEGNLNDIIRSVKFFLGNQYKQKKIDFDLDLDETTPSFKFDPEQIENVLLNLGMNAVQTITGEGTITFRTAYHPINQRVRICVSDTGEGIPEDKLKAIFNPFFTMKTEGTGLGLAIAKEIVEMHQGEIWVVNNPEKGCTFHISLPAGIEL